MKINPVYGKEVKLRVRSLKFAMTILFFNLGLVAIALLGFEMIFNINMNYRIDYSAAITVYFVIICIEAAMVAFLVPVFTAGSIAGEREKQTLEILLTTVLKPGQIVIGKLMSSISMVVLLVFSSLPVVSIIFTIGGINMADLFQFVVFIIVMSLFIGSMGVCASAMLKKAIPATVISFVMVGVVCGVTAIAVFVANEGANIYYYTVQNSSGDVPDVTWTMYPLLINPAFTIFHMVSEQFMGENLLSYMASALNGELLPFVQDYWFLCSIAVQLVFTVLFLKLAALFLDPLRRKEKARKNNNKTKKKKKAAAAALLFLVLAIAPASTQTASASVKIRELDNEGKIKISKDDISASVRLGYKGKAKYNRSIRADAVIENKGSDFTGKFRVEYARTDSNGYIAIQKEFAVAAGESKKVQFALPDIEEGRNIRVAVCDSDNDIICSEYVKLNYKDNIDTLYIGTLSDSQDSLKYIASGMAADKTSFSASDEGIIFELLSDDITEDEKMIDVLDVIIIDNFDTGKFSKGQINAIKKWVSKGGTLFLGSGADAGKVLDAFSGTLLKGTIGSAKSIRTNFGVTRAELTSLLGENLANKRVPLDITQIKINGSKPVLTDGRNKLASVKEYGSGNIITAEFSLALSPGTSRLYGPVIVDVIRNNISEQRKQDLGLSSGNSWQSYSEVYMSEADLLNLNSTDSLPNIKLYAVILLVYVFLAGPLSYIILKKKDRRNLLWFIVPVLSVVFSVTIYLIGTSTRIQKPFINYSSTIELPEKGNSSHNVNTSFTITNSSSKSYEMVLPENTDISPSSLNGYYSSYYYSDDEAGEYDYGIEYSASNITLQMNNLSAFESVPFKMSNRSSSTGTVEANVKKTDDKISGFITNKMSCGLEDCIFYCKGTMYYIGAIPSGKSVDISKQKSFKDSNYSYSFESQLSAAMGGSFYDNSVDVSLRRQIGMIQVFITNNKLSDTWFYGFVPEDEETSFTGKFPYDKYGATGVYKQVQVQETLDGYDVIGMLEQYADQYDENDTNGFYIYDTTRKELEVTYKFPENFTLKRIIYNKETAGGCEFNLNKYQYAETAFVGAAKVKDRTTGEYAELIQSGKKADIDGMEKYLEDDGSLTVYYEIGNIQNGGVDSYILPKVKLAGTYKKTGKRS